MAANRNVPPQKHSVLSDTNKGLWNGSTKGGFYGFVAGAGISALWTLPVAVLAGTVTALAVAFTAPASLPIIGAGFVGSGALGIAASAGLAMAGAISAGSALIGSTVLSTAGAFGGAASGAVAGAGSAVMHNRIVDNLQHEVQQQQGIGVAVQSQRNNLIMRGQQAAAVVQTAANQPHAPSQHHHAMSSPALQAAAPQNVVANEMELAGRVEGIQRAASMA